MRIRARSFFPVPLSLKKAIAIAALTHLGRLPQGMVHLLDDSLESFGQGRLNHYGEPLHRL